MFRDFNGNGTYDTAVAIGVAKDVGLGGVGVVVTDGSRDARNATTETLPPWTVSGHADVVGADRHDVPGRSS